MSKAPKRIIKDSKTKLSRETTPTETQLKILRIYGSNYDANVTAVAELAGVSRQSVYAVLQKPFAKQYKVERARRQQRAGKTTLDDIQKLAELLSGHIEAMRFSDEGIDIQEVGGLYKLLVDGAAKLKEHGLEEATKDVVDEADLEAACNELLVAFQLGHEFEGSDEALAQMLEYFQQNQTLEGILEGEEDSSDSVQLQPGEMLIEVELEPVECPQEVTQDGENQ